MFHGHSQEQKDQDKEMRRKWKLWKIQLAKYLINDLKNYGPANLMYINALSSVTRKSIRVWTSKGCLYRTINNNRTNENEIVHPIDVEYHKQGPNCIGHWTLLGNKDPFEIEHNLNGCLFAVIAAQTERSTDDLRTSTVEFLTNNVKHLIDQIDKLSASDNNETLLMIGGARYTGTSPKAAAIILDNSQNVLCAGCREFGHPRGHASDKNATGPNDSVENYSLTTRSMKSGFLSRSDQNKVAHFALSHTKAQEAMGKLNNGAYSMSVTMSYLDFPIPLPKMKEYFHGEEYSGELGIERVTLVLRHHQNKNNNPNADVFVHTIYPRCN